ncbi:MAG: hypothetical protein WBI55_00930 [Eubacteriales bacterium]
MKAWLFHGKIKRRFFFPFIFFVEREKFTAEAADTAGLFGRERYVGVFLTVNVALLVVLLALSVVLY